MENITAEQARKLTEANIPKPRIEPFVDVLNKHIKLIAMRGKSLCYPWHHINSLRMSNPTEEEQDLIKQHFLQQGFSWTDASLPPNTSPAIISW
jgi:hypothetical protein